MGWKQKVRVRDGPVVARQRFPLEARLTLSPLEVRTDKALRTSRAMLCFFTV